MKNLGYYNGNIGEIENVSIPMGDRVCFFGDGVYDATYSKNYKIFALNEHIDRFFNSAELLGFNLNFTKTELALLLSDLVKKMDTGENFVYFQLTRGTENIRSHAFPDKNVPCNLMINIYHKEISNVYNKVKLITMEDTRFFHCNIKTVNLIPSVMASQRAKELGATETILHRNKRVTECSHSNVHILKNNTLITAPTDCLILPGITRKHLINACKQLGIAVEEKPYYLDEVFTADEVIITSAGQLCLSASTVDGVEVGGKAPSLLKTLQDYMLNEFLEETNLSD